MCSFALFTPTAIHTTCLSASILIQPINTMSTPYISLYALPSIDHTLLSTNTISYYCSTTTTIPIIHIQLSAVYSQLEYITHPLT
ncbi:hypothetical protein BDF22DRAFT_702106, partial [Syncephalis plumigaleata]